MEYFVLVVMLISPAQNYGGGLNQSVAMQEFTSEYKCSVAQKVVTQHYEQQYGRIFKNGVFVDVVKAVCIRK